MGPCIVKNLNGVEIPQRVLPRSSISCSRPGEGTYWSDQSAWGAAASDGRLQGREPGVDRLKAPIRLGRASVSICPYPLCQVSARYAPI